MTDGIDFRELSIHEIGDQGIVEINHLLPQVSSSGVVVTRRSLVALFTSGTRLFAALDNGHIIAVVLLASMTTFTGRKAWIDHVVTDEAYRGRGISFQLMELAEVAARDELAVSLNLTSNPSRYSARKLYERLGFTLRLTDVFQKPL